MISLKHYDLSEIELNGRIYKFSDFLKLEPNYTVPFGFSKRVYIRGEEHYISDGSNTRYMRLIDPYCDSICNREGELARLVERLKNESSD